MSDQPGTSRIRASGTATAATTVYSAQMPAISGASPPSWRAIT